MHLNVLCERLPSESPRNIPCRSQRQSASSSRRMFVVQLTTECETTWATRLECLEVTIQQLVHLLHLRLYPHSSFRSSVDIGTRGLDRIRGCRIAVLLVSCFAISRTRCRMPHRLTRHRGRWQFWSTHRRGCHLIFRIAWCPASVLIISQVT